MFPSDTDFDTKVTLETEIMPIPEDQPFHILILGDWSGKENQCVKSDLSEIRPIEIDRDNFDQVLKKLSVKLDLNFQGNDENKLSLQFDELDDFHPDKIFQNLPLFADLRDIRQRLVKQDTFEFAAREVRSWFTESKDEKTENTQSDVTTAEKSASTPDDLLDQILGQVDENVSASQRQPGESTELSSFIKKIVKPHLVQVDFEEQSKLLIIVDEVISDLMRKILHHPHFQVLESAWRGVFLLVRQAETDSHLKIYLLNISKSELTDNLKSTDDLTESKIYRYFAANSEPWALVCGNYSFSLNIDDVAALIRLAKIANNTNTPFISNIKPEMFGFDCFGDADSSNNWKINEDSTENKLWMMLRAVPETTHLGLALPRFLARLPYGEKIEPTEVFYFEEFRDAVPHKHYLWSNPIFICATLLAKTFTKYGWEMSGNFLQDITNLPIYQYKDNGETKTKSCAEITFTEDNCEKLLQQGLIPLISFRDTDRIKVGRFQAVAESFSMLKGKWN